MVWEEALDEPVHHPAPQAPGHSVDLRREALDGKGVTVVHQDLSKPPHLLIEVVSALSYPVELGAHSAERLNDLVVLLEDPELDPVQTNRALRRYVPDTGFVGRDETLLLLDRAFDHSPVVLLHAYAGQGKSATAVEFARWYAQTGGL